MPAELHYAADIGSLCRRREIADGHVLDHTATERAHLGHLGTSCPKGWAVDTLILADRRRPSRPLSFCRDSGFVQSPDLLEEAEPTSPPTASSAWAVRHALMGEPRWPSTKRNRSRTRGDLKNSTNGRLITARPAKPSGTASRNRSAGICAM